MQFIMHHAVKRKKQEYKSGQGLCEHNMLNSIFNYPSRMVK